MAFGRSVVASELTRLSFKLTLLFELTTEMNVRSGAAITVVCMLAIGTAGAANARLGLSPQNTPFELHGVLSLTSASGPQPCVVTFTGMTFSGGGVITGASSKSCAITFFNFPSSIDFEKPKSGFFGMYYILNGTTCEDGVTFTTSGKGIWTLSNRNNCAVAGMLKSTPAIILTNH